MALGIGLGIGPSLYSASGNWWLSGAAVDVDFAGNRVVVGSTPTAFTSLLSCSRASTAYARTAAGVLQSFSSNVLRRTDYGLLIEEASTNLFANSQVFSSAAPWNADIEHLTIADNAVVAPDGTTTAATLTEDSATANHQMGGGTVTGPSNSTLTSSIYVKPASRTWCAMYLFDASLSHWFWAFFNLSGAGAVGTSGASAATFTSANIEQLANGWYRCSITGLMNAGTSYIPYFYSCSADNVNNMAGNSSIALNVWGAQLENEQFATSYIPTSGSTATRATDLITTSGALATLLNADTLSVVEAFNMFGNVTSARLWAGDTTASFINGKQLTVSPDGSDTFSTSNSIALNTLSRAGISWSAAGGSTGVLNGGAVNHQSYNGSTSANTYFGNRSDGLRALNAYVTRFTGWSTQLTDTALQAFTAT